MKTPCLFLIAIVTALFSCVNNNTSHNQKDNELAETLLVSEFNPKSIYKIPRSHIAKPKYPVIDIHSHAYPKTEEQVGAVGETYG